MKSAHLGFALFLIFLLVVPKLPSNLDIMGLPERSSLSLGFVGLLIWMLLSPTHLLRVRILKNHLILVGLMVFAFFALGVSLLSGKSYSIAYGLQYLFYVVVGFIMVSGYINRAIRLKQERIALGIFGGVGLIFAAGIIVSFWTGPFYPHQARDNILHLGELEQHRATGFAESVNMAGAQLLVFAGLALAVGFSSKAYVRFLFFGIFLTALLLTASRGAVLALAAAILLLACFKLVSLAVWRRELSRALVSAYTLLFIGTLVFTALLTIPRAAESTPVLAVTQRFTVDEKGGTVFTAAAGRSRIWSRSLAIWKNASPLDALMGQGFRGTQSISSSTWDSPHNAYVSMLTDFGLIGLLLFVVPLVGLFLYSAMRILTVRRQKLESFSFVALASLLIANMSGDYFYSPILISLTIITALFVVSSFSYPNFGLPGGQRAVNRPARAPRPSVGSPLG